MGPDLAPNSKPHKWTRLHWTGVTERKGNYKQMKQDEAKKQFEFYLLHSNSWSWLFCFPGCFNSTWFSLPPLCFPLTWYSLRANKNRPNQITLQLASVHNGYNRNINTSYRSLFLNLFVLLTAALSENGSSRLGSMSHCDDVQSPTHRNWPEVHIPRRARFYLPAFTPSPTSYTWPVIYRNVSLWKTVELLAESKSSISYWLLNALWTATSILLGPKVSN